MKKFPNFSFESVLQSELSFALLCDILVYPFKEFIFRDNQS